MNSKRELVKSGYDKCARNYLDNRDLFKNQKYLDDLVRKLQKGSKILDLGCGSGIPIDEYLFNKGFYITGIDISEEQIKLAKKNLPGGNFLAGDMSEIDYPQESFDGIVSFYAIFHVPRKEHELLFKKMFFILKPEGYLLVTMGSDDWEGTEDDFHGSKMFWSHYGSEKNIKIVESAGFKVVYKTIDTSGEEKHLVILAKKER